MRTLDNGSIEPVWARIRDRNSLDISAMATDIELAYGLESNEDAPVLGWEAPIDAEVLKPWLIRIAREVEAIRVGDDPTNYKLWARFGPGPTIKLLGKFRVQ